MEDATCGVATFELLHRSDRLRKVVAGFLRDLWSQSGATALLQEWSKKSKASTS